MGLVWIGILGIWRPGQYLGLFVVHQGHSWAVFMVHQGADGPCWGDTDIGDCHCQEGLYMVQKSLVFGLVVCDMWHLHECQIPRTQWPKEMINVIHITCRWFYSWGWSVYSNNIISHFWHTCLKSWKYYFCSGPFCWGKGSITDVIDFFYSKSLKFLLSFIMMCQQ